MIRENINISSSLSINQSNILVVVVVFLPGEVAFEDEIIHVIVIIE